MRKNRRISGFTLMELLVVVAILGILAGVSFVAVQRYQRSTEQLEVDTVAKEIFIAAQNHLTMSRNEGYLGLKSDAWGDFNTAEEDKGIYYIVCSEGDITDGAEDMLGSVILPFGSIDETVRGGNYIIRYQPQFGLVLDVFYSKAKNTRFGYDLTNEYNTLISGYLGDGNKSGRRNYGGKGKVIGYYGGQEANDILKVEGFSATGNAGMGEFVLKKPVLTVNNSDTLTVKVKDDNSTVPGYILKLIVKGETSKNEKAIVLRTASGAAGEFTQKLDDITQTDKHFANLFPGFIPGENITLQAVAYTNEKLSNIGYSDVEMTNSLFEKLEWDNSPGIDASATKLNKVSINNIRHLENLDTKVSSFAYMTADGVGTVASGTEQPTAIAVTHAVQTSDMKWNDSDPSVKDSFVENIGSTCAILYTEGGTVTATEPACFKPVDLEPVNNMPFTYDGNKKNIFNLKVAPKTGDGAVTAWDAGMFGNVSRVTTVKNLALIDSDMKALGTGNAGALAGTITSASTIENVVAYNSTSAQTATVKDTGISTDNGSKGGLIGSATGCTINKCAAALVVESTGGNAGGLIGSMSGGTVTACYSGGHTGKGMYYQIDATTGDFAKDASTGNKIPLYNITATSGTVGGLIGVVVTKDDDKTTVEACYSTCSVKGKVAGGFVGTFDGKSITNCYATGLVCGIDNDAPIVEEGVTVTRPKDGAFAYSVTATTVTDCRYFEIVNERVKRDTIENGEKKATIYATVTETDQDTSKNTYVYLTALGKNDKTSTGITALDADATAYEGFVGAPATWKTAIPYDAKLLEYYSVKDTDNKYMSSFNLKGISSLDTSTDYTTAPYKDYFVTRHYGDWPAPEIFVFNTAS